MAKHHRQRVAVLTKIDRQENMTGNKAGSLGVKSTQQKKPQKTLRRKARKYAIGPDRE